MKSVWERKDTGEGSGEREVGGGRKEKGEKGERAAGGRWPRYIKLMYARRLDRSIDRLRSAPEKLKPDARRRAGLMPFELYPN